MPQKITFVLIGISGNNTWSRKIEIACDVSNIAGISFRKSVELNNQQCYNEGSIFEFISNSNVLIDNRSAEVTTTLTR